MSLKMDNLNLAGKALVELRGMAREVKAARRAAGDPLAEVTAGWVGPHYLLSLRKQMGLKPEGPERHQLLRWAVVEAGSLQRGDSWSARIELERERLEFQRQKHRDKLAGKLPEANERRKPRPMTDEELKACVDKVDEIMGLKRT